jgi:RNA polymerase sigma-70 factor (ECF subfamily)
MVLHDEEFRALYDAHASRIRRYAARLVGEAEAEDVTQEVFARAHRAIATHRGDSRLSTWLFRIATNAAVDRLRSAARREAPGARTEQADAAEEEILAGGAACEAEADSRVIRKEMSGCVLGLVDRLAPPHRAVILLGELRDLSDREIADALGITLEAAKMRLHRARRELRKLLESSCSLYRDERNELACEPRVPARPAR